MKLKLSEFISNDDMELHYKDNLPSSNVNGADTYILKKGEAIPEIFVTLYLKNNPKLLQNLIILNGIPQLTEEQEKKYGIKFVRKITTFEQESEKEKSKFTLEDLNVKVNELGKTKFKDWAENTFGKEKIDKRKATENIAADILEIQDEEK